MIRYQIANCGKQVVKRKTRISTTLLIALCSLLISCENPYYLEMLEPTLNRLNGSVITFNTNGATSGTAPEELIVDSTHSFTFPDDSGFERTGYIFSGWNTETDGTGENYFPADQYTPEASMTFYANWIPITYTITYDKNAPDATGTTAGSFHIYDIAQALTANGYVLFGHTFVNWSAAADGTGAVYYNKDEVVNLSAADGDTVILYAQWADNAITFTLDIEEITNGTPQIDDAITISRTGEAAGVGAGPYVTHEVMLINPGRYDPGSILWEIAGVGAYAGTVVTGTGSPFILNAADERYNSLGGHTLRLEVRINGTLYRKNIIFTVVN